MLFNPNPFSFKKGDIAYYAASPNPFHLRYKKGIVKKVKIIEKNECFLSYPKALMRHNTPPPPPIPITLYTVDVGDGIKYDARDIELWKEKEEPEKILNHLREEPSYKRYIGKTINQEEYEKLKKEKEKENENA